MRYATWLLAGLVAACLVTAGCTPKGAKTVMSLVSEPNLEIGHIWFHGISPTQVGVHARIQNDGNEHATQPFRVLIFNQTTGGAPMVMHFQHGLKADQSRVIHASLAATSGQVIVVRIDPDDHVAESDEGDNVRKKPAP